MHFSAVAPKEVEPELPALFAAYESTRVRGMKRAVEFGIILKMTYDAQSDEKCFSREGGVSHLKERKLV